MKQQTHLQPFVNSIDSLFIELLEDLCKPAIGRTWLQKVVNLLKQVLSARNISLFTLIDNLTVFANNDSDFLDNKIINETTDKTNEPYWFKQCYVVPLSVEGRLIINWDDVPDDSEIKKFNYIFSLLSVSLENRADLISKENNISYDFSFEKMQEIFGKNNDLRSQIPLVAKEIATSLNVSRCQVKFFTQDVNPVFDTLLSSEYVTGRFVDAISVIPSIEKEWLQKIQSGEMLILDQKQNHFLQNIESLLSIQSILGFPLRYKENIIGAIVLHQCDYERTWKYDEISYIRKVALLLSIVAGKEIEFNKKLALDAVDLNTGLIHPEQFLRELNRAQIEAQVKKSCFSLVMVDIEKLKDINLKMGFVAGNLVLSQTARYLKRLFGDLYKIARYNNDEFVIILNEADQHKAKAAAEKLKEHLSNVSVLGIGTIEYNFSFVTFPVHTDSIAELLTLLEQSMILSKSRGKFQVTSFDEIKDKSKSSWQKLLDFAIPEIILKKSSLKTGPEIIETINKQVAEFGKRKTYSADILDSVQSLALALDAKDSYTEGHSNRVAEYAYLLAKELGLDSQEIEWIRLAASMHDIGKIGIPENILCKPGKLTKDEYEIMKKHPVIGAKILKPIKPLEKVATLVLNHHEYWDGAGYPNGLAKNEVPIGSRIVSVVDAYQAMTSNRPYRPSLQFEEAIKRLREGREKQWDPELVDLFIKIVS
ncbi:MAG: HD domain-containing protein [Candidatus Melainabacteria bacterium]|nr:HD domain-containing protein [Candidatus Melainabacteria bacterium]